MARRRFYRKIYRRNKRNERLKSVLKISISCLLFLAFFCFFVFIYYAKDLPRPEVFTERPFILPAKIYDREGEVLLYQIYGEEKRTIISLNQVPEYLKQAVIVAEDVNFYHHFGLDLRGIFRAVLTNLKIGKPLYGGSTISQQLIRSSFLTGEKTLERKMKEIILTLELERRYSKDQILEFYLNQVPFGSNAYGVEAASQAYFNKPASRLSLGEASLLASLIRAPSYLSPYGENKDELLARKNYILERMINLGFVTKEGGEEAKKEILDFATIRQPIKAPHFVLYVKKYLEENYSDYFLKEKGLKVYTTLDWELQKLAEEAIKEGVKNNKGYNAHNAALVTINPKTGEILAMVGSADYFADSYPENCSPGLDCLFEPMVNVAVYGEGRQPGSAFKPFAYAQAFKRGFTPDTILWDARTEFNPDCDSASTTQEKDEYGLDCYHPENYDEKFRGLVTFRQALAQSINVPSVKVLYLAGIKETIDLAQSFGINTLNKPLSWYGLSLVLGGGEVKLLDMVSAYGVFATEGLRVPPISILKIEDSEGNIIEENKRTPKRVLESQVARLISDILSDNEARSPIFGERSPLYFSGYEVAAKTGTTQDFRDGWVVGYTPSIVVGVWVGNNNNAEMVKEPGVVLAGPIWHRFMEKVLTLHPPEDFIKPNPVSVEKPILKGEINWEDPHSILHYIDKNNPRGSTPEHPEDDPQYESWEYALQTWLQNKINP